MVASPHPDTVTLRRLVRESLEQPAAPRSLPSGVHPDRDYGARGGSEHASLEDDVSSSIRAVERVVESFGTMKENFQFYRDMVNELRSKLDEERTQREEIHREFMALERIVKAERERASRAETSAKAAETTIKELEQHLSSVRSQTARLVKSVTMLIAAEIDARGDEPEKGLRLVS